ncbi:lysozyme [Citrobacter freundii]|uniref:lysozyme n=1 Tax=Citrobacter freundii TaxID=546 RepID=UPI0021B82525|nr:lysozyme [Citrobacter freundii]
MAGRWEPGKICEGNVMQTSDKGIALIKEFEGCKLTAYQDSVGVWTIGYGWTQPVDGKPIRAGMTIKQETAERLLKTGLVRYESDVSRLVKVGLTQGQFDALVSFTYNLGSRALSTSTLLRKLNCGDYTGSADEFLRWNKAGGKVLNGLTRRREAERALFLS